MKFQKKINYYHNSQKGVTLLLSILVLSALVAISFSFASIILIEVKSSGDLARTEPAYYAVQGVVEETIFKIKRSVPPNYPGDLNEFNFDFGGCNSNTYVNNVGVRVTAENKISLYSGICNRSPKSDVTDLVLPTAGGDEPANTNNIYNIYDPDNPYTNTYTIPSTNPGCVSGNQCPSAYSSVEFHYLSGATSKIYFCAADKDCFTDGWDASATLDSTLANQCWQFRDVRPVIGVAQASGCNTAHDILPNKAYQFFVVNPAGPGNAGINIISSGPDPQTNHGPSLPGVPGPTTVVPKGLPLFGESSVNVTASYLGLTRKYQVTIPRE